MLSSIARILIAQSKNKAKPNKENEYPTQYEKILNGAKFKNHKKIREALADVSIHVCDSSNLPPISRLAAAGDKESVDFLKLHFDDSEVWAACGYAQALNISAIEELLCKYPSRRPYILAEAVYGFVIAKRPDLASKVIYGNAAIRGILNQYYVLGLGEVGDLFSAESFMRSAQSPKLTMLPLLVFGLGLKAHDVLFEEVLFSHSNYKINLLEKYIGGLGVGGHETEIFQVLDKHPQSRFALLEVVLEGLARSEKTNLISKIQSSYSSSRTKLLAAQVRGFIAGGYFTQAETILKNYPILLPEMLPEIALYLAIFKHVKKAGDFIEAHPEQIAQSLAGFAQSGIIEEAAYTSEDLSDVQRQEIKRKVIHGYGLALNYSRADDLLAKNQADKSSLAVQLACGYICGGNCDLAMQLFKQIEVESALDFDQYEMIAMTLASQGLGWEIEEFIASAPEDFRQALVMSVAKTYAEKCYFDLALRLLEFVSQLRAEIITTMADELKPVLSSEVDCLHLLATLDNKNYRQELAAAHKLANPESPIMSLLPQVDKINRVSKQYKLSYLQAIGWIRIDCQLWHLQGVQLIKKGLLTDALFLNISAFLVGVDRPALIDLTKKQHQKFFQNTRSTPTLFTMPKPPKPKARINLLSADGKTYDLRKMR
jgi:hypothetical protein